MYINTRHTAFFCKPSAGSVPCAGFVRFGFPYSLYLKYRWFQMIFLKGPALFRISFLD